MGQRDKLKVQYLVQCTINIFNDLRLKPLSLYVVPSFLHDGTTLISLQFSMEKRPIRLVFVPSFIWRLANNYCTLCSSN